MTTEVSELCKALTQLANEMRANRDSVARLEQIVSRFVVATERQLASGEAVRRRAERQLRGMEPDTIASMNKLLDRKLGRRT
jgi:hypothetical protein